MKRINGLDLDLGVSEEATQTWECLSTKQFKISDRVRMHTSAWYNGRERGVCIRVTNFTEREHFIVTFGCNRNSDRVFVDSWEDTEKVYINPPTSDDLTEEVYRKRTVFLSPKEAAQFIFDKLEDKGFIKV